MYVEGSTRITTSGITAFDQIRAILYKCSRYSMAYALCLIADIRWPMASGLCLIADIRWSVPYGLCYTGLYLIGSCFDDLWAIWGLASI